MSGYLGYDPDLIEMLYGAMSAAETELIDIQCVDPDGQVGIHKVHRATATLRDRWVPFVRSLTTCVALDGYRPATIDSGDLLNSYLAMIIAGNGWRTSTDPLASIPQSFTVEQAVALATWINEHGDDLDDDLDDGELGALQVMLAKIASSPTMSDAFVSTSTTDAVAALVERMGRLTTDLDRERDAFIIDEHGEVLAAAASAIIAGLGRIIVASSPGNPSTQSIIGSIGSMHPYGAAMLVSHLALDARTLADVVDQILVADWPDVEVFAGVTIHSSPIDILLTEVLRNGDAASRLIVSTADHPRVLLDPCGDPNLIAEILLRGTGPDVLSEREQAAVIPNLLGWLWKLIDSPGRLYLDHYAEHGRDLSATTAAVIAPYLLQVFDPTNTQFGLTNSSRATARDFLTSNPTLLSGLDDLRDRLGTSFDTPLGLSVAHDLLTLESLAHLVAILDRLYLQSGVNVAIANQETWDFYWSMLSKLSAVAPGPYKVATRSAVTGTEYLVEYLHLDPEHVDAAEARIRADSTVRSALVAGYVATATFSTLVSQGKLSAGNPPPQPDLDAEDVALTYTTALDTWAAHIDGGDPGAALFALQVVAASHTILNPNQAMADALDGD